MLGETEPVGGVPQAPAAADLHATGERIDALIESLAVGGVGPANPTRTRERAEELVRVVTDLYGAGLERLLEILHEGGQLDEQVLRRLAADELVAGLLVVHGLHPYDVRTRVEDALESVRPYLGSHAGDVELLDVSEDGVVQLRLLGSCDGCASSSVTLELAVQDAIEAAAPEVVSVQVETPSSEPATGTLIPVDSLRSRLGTASSSDPSTGVRSGWHSLPGAADLVDGRSLVVDVGGVPLFSCRVGRDVFAFRDACARCSSSLHGVVPERRLGGAVGDAVLTCHSCGAHFDVRRAGACLDDDTPEWHLDPFPVLVEGGDVRVALPAAVTT